MNKKGVMDLAHRLVDQNPGVVKDSYLSHLNDTYDIARETVMMAFAHYPCLREHMNIEEVALAGGLHDIGRPLQKNQLFHELRGARLIEQKGLDFGITNNIVDIYRIAQMFRSHGTIYERFIHPDLAEERKEFEPIGHSLLLPRTLQEAIIVYSDFSNVGGKRISYEERVADIKERYSTTPNSTCSIAIRQGLPRISKVYEKVRKLREGKLSEEEIFRYGFL